LDGLTRAYIQDNQLEKALETLDQGIKLVPHRPQGLEFKAEILQRLGKPKAALQALNAALDLLPRDPALLGRKAGLLRAGQDWSAALDAAAQAFELDPGNVGYLQAAAELAVLCLQPTRASGFFSATTQAGFVSFDLACLQAELALEAGEEIAAAKLLAPIAESHAAQPRLLALQAQLAACGSDRSQAAELLQEGLAALPKHNSADIFATLGLAKAAEKLNEWETVINMYEGLTKDHPGLLAALFGLGRALTLRAEWQHLCEVSGASQDVPGAAALSKQSRAAALQAFNSAAAAASDAAIQAMLAGWQKRAELRFGADLDLDALPHGCPCNAGEAAALIFAAQRSDSFQAAVTRIKSYKSSPEVLVELALADTQPEMFEQFAQAASQLPRSAPVQALAAQAAYKSGKEKQALPFIQRALALWPTQPNWQALGGSLQQAQGRLAEASQHFKLAAELEPDEAKHYFALGQAQAAAKLVSAAVESLQKAVNLQPKQAEYLLALAKAHRQAGNDQQAKSFAQQAHKAAPKSPAALLLQAELALGDKDALRAKDLVEQALRQAPKDPAALQLFGETLYALGQAEDAVAVLDRAAKAAADEVPILIRRAQFLPEGRGRDALVKLSQKYPQRAEVFFALSQMLALTGNLAEAVQAAQHAVKKVGILPAELGASIHLHLGLLLKHSGNLDQSLHHMDEAIRLRPQALDAYLERGRVFLSRRQHGQAIAAFQQAAAVAPLSAAPHFEAGMALKDAKDYTAAESELRKAARLAPKDRDIQRQLAAIIALNLVHHRQEVGAQA
jgi:tetratricopeptide (TPR) repeat protein